MKCAVDGCGKESRTRGFCGKHYAQVLRYGGTKERTRKDGNSFILKNGCAEIVMYDNQSNETGRAIVDVSDYELVNGYKWYIKDGYVCTRIGNKLIKIHRLIMNTPDGMDTDHINHNKLDNRRNNLRICTRAENSRNKASAGVDYQKRRKKWRARIKLAGKEVCLGYFDTKEEAEAIRKAAEITHYGEYAYRGDKSNAD